MDKNPRKYLENRIAYLRKERGMTLEQLGQAMPSKLTASTIAKLEKGRMGLSADYIAELADVLNVEFEEVVKERQNRRQNVVNEELNDGDLCLVATDDGDITTCIFDKDDLAFIPQSGRSRSHRIKVGAERFVLVANLGVPG